MHRHILTELASPYARFCFDVGHLTAFAKCSWQVWLPVLAEWLGQLHLHDNMGDRDDHLAVGAGSFNFPELFAYLKSCDLTPIVTLEPHREKDLWKSLKALDRFNLFDHKKRD